jgi:hypothetical protein
VDSDPPKGLIVHTHYEKDGRVHIDVWDSFEAHDIVGQSRLGQRWVRSSPPAGSTWPRLRRRQPLRSLTLTGSFAAIGDHFWTGHGWRRSVRRSVTVNASGPRRPVCRARRKRAGGWQRG